MSKIETHICGSRQTTPTPPGYADRDTWRAEANGDRTCSFCGSLHHDDWLRLMRDALDPKTETRIDLSDKGYKFYVHQAGVRNASQGGIKFYTWHIPSDAWAAEANAIHKDVTAASRAKFEAHMQKLGLRP